MKNNHYGDVTHKQVHVGQVFCFDVGGYNVIAGPGLGGWGIGDLETYEMIEQTNFMGGHSTLFGAPK